MSGIGLKCFGFGNGVYETLIGAPIRRLSITGIPNAPSLFRILPTLTGLEELNVSTVDFCCDFKLPQVIRLINFDPIICSSSSLANFVASVSTLKHTIKCNMRICKMETNKKPVLVICPEWFSSPPEIFLQQTQEEVSIKYDQVDYFGMAEALVSVIKVCLPTGLKLGKPEKGFSRVRSYMTGFIKQKLNAIENSEELLASDCPVMCKLSIRHEEFFKKDKTEKNEKKCT
ncbi:hypothetical protein DPMN_121229 [Dreissena polymorpha]|uniref:Uncharacterized protein n=1 Tax=Dreissena polymorpha TaxID=45954 RepID=A0A9D4GMD9_DREPO|nr:hypothetical protein DPMN_121229 [Dreissena polymorpha]